MTFETPLDHGPVRLRLAAVAGIVAVPLLVVRAALSSRVDLQHLPTTLTWAADHPGGALVANLSETAGFALAAFCCATLTGLVRGRGRWLTQIGGWGTTISYLVIAFSSFGMVVAAVADRPDRAATAQLLEHAQHSVQLLPVLIGLGSSVLWPVLLAFGLPRAGLVGWWYAGVGVASLALGAVGGTGLLSVVTQVLPLAVLVGVWVRILLVRAASVSGPAAGVAVAEPVVA